MAVKSAGYRAVGSTIYDSDNGVHCHQCRQKTRNFAAACKNPKKDKPCLVKLCNKCLLNRYGEKMEEIAGLEEWVCPKCRGICNCSVCMKRRGHQPTGILINAAKETGFSSVSEMLLKSAERLNHENEVVFYPRKRGKENSFDGQLDAHLPESAGKKVKGLLNGKAVDNTTLEICNQDPDMIVLNQEGLKGTDLTSVAGIDMPAEDVGNALELLEFCSAFGKILEIKNGEAEYVLQDIFHGRQPAHRGKLCSTVQFHILLLTIIKTEQGEKFVKLSPSYGKNSWFEVLKKSLSESQRVLKESAVDSLEKASDYDALNASEKLRILNLLCIEVLGTKKLRNWIEDQNTQHDQKAKEAKQEVLGARDKIKSLEQKIRDDVAKSIDARDGEQEATVSHIKSEAAQAHAKLLESKAMLLKINQTAHATRVEPVFMGNSGHVYWKLNCSGESDVLHQYVGKGDTLALNEKWFALSDEKKEVIEKYISAGFI
ncbi:hypothetical protein C2S51_031947 [Perilla frutescens var. frutescens]|nr:hypothetical protein C2S51_031947 [Perilla frutescens var. frutescens]